jgi:hypothetical protein
VQTSPYARLLPVPKPPPASYAAAEPHLLGHIRQGMPLLRTNTIPESTARFGIRGLPPLALDGSVGSRGSTIRHSSSLTSCSLMSASLAPREVLKPTLSPCDPGGPSGRRP